MAGVDDRWQQRHDHKFDPLTQKEYYQFFAFFNNQDEPTLEMNDPRQSQLDCKSELKKAEIEVDEFILAHAAKYDAWEQSVTAELLEKLPSDLREGLETERSQRTPQQVRDLFNIEVGKIDSRFQSLKQHFDKLGDQVAGVTKTLVLREREQPRMTSVFIKGDFHARLKWSCRRRPQFSTDCDPRRIPPKIPPLPISRTLSIGSTCVLAGSARTIH